MAFGEKLQEVRKQSGMTQETFAEQLHVSRQAVSRWESGRGYPEIEKILYICHRYHTTLDALFADELPPIEAEEAEVEQPIAGKPLKRSFVDFLSNLSPYDKLIGGTLIFIVLLSLMALAHSMKGGSGGNMTFVWIAAIVIFGIAEAATAGLVSIWFVAGAVAALLSLELGAVLWLQIVVFLAVSIAALVATRRWRTKCWIRPSFPPTPTACCTTQPRSPRPSTTKTPPAPSTSTAKHGPPAARTAT